MKCRIFLCFAFLLFFVCPSFGKVFIQNNEIKFLKPIEGVFVFRIPNNGKFEVVPYVSDNLITNRDVFNITKSKLVINAGFFDPSNQKTTSNVVINQKLAADLKDNENLIKNKKILPHLNKISNRGEFRVLKVKNKIKYDICYPYDAVEKNETIVHSIQGGPIILPVMDLEKEFFILKDEKGKVIREAASVLQKRARSVVALKKNSNDLYFIVVSKENPMSLPQLQRVLMSFGFEKALNLDGGPSTSVNFKDFEIFSSNKTPRKLKSFLIVR